MDTQPTQSAQRLTSKTLLYLLIFWQGLHDSVLVGVSAIVASNEAAAHQVGSAFLPPYWAIAATAFVAFAIALNRHLINWIDALRKMTQ